MKINKQMDCIEFRNKTADYLNNTLSDEELNEYLHHFACCKTCAEDLEINYIVLKGIDLLDREDVSYDIKGSYEESIQESIRSIRRRKVLIRLTYIADTLTFWGVSVALFLFLRIMLIG